MSLEELTEPQKADVLKYVAENDIINLPTVLEQIQMNVKKKYLEMHNHKIWKTTTGQWCTYLDDKTKPKGRLLIRKKEKGDVENLVIQFYKDKEEKPTIEAVFHEWNDRRLELQKIKKATHTRNEQIFDRFFKKMGSHQIAYVTPTDWEDFLCAVICEYQLNAKSFANLKGIVKGFLKRAKKRKLIAFDVETFFLELDISDSDFKKKVLVEENEVYFDDEMEAMMDLVRENPDTYNLCIALMFVTGIRIGEAVALKNSDFETDTIFRIKRTETRYRKDSEHFVYDINEQPKTPAGYRTVIIPESQKWIAEKIRMINPSGDFIFIDKKGERMHAEHIRCRLRRNCQKLNISARKSPHKIRKTYGSILLDNGVDRKLIEGQMGHTNIITTEQFYHRNRKRLDEKQAILNNIPEFANIMHL